MDHRIRLRSLLVDRSLALGDFTLASGIRSSYYIDVRLTTMCAEGQFLIGQVGLSTVREHFPGVGWVGGMTLGADPIAYAIAHRSWIEQTPIEAFTVRKEAKAHGMGRRVEGGLPPSLPVVVVEDALTSGKSALDAIAALEEHGARIAGVLTVVDRESGGRERLAERGYPLISLFTARELLSQAGVDPS